MQCQFSLFKRVINILFSATLDEKVDYEILKKAFNIADEAHKDQRRRSGEPYIIHPVAVAKILADMGMDADSVCAALLHDTVEDCSDKTNLETLSKMFGVDVAMLVDADILINLYLFLGKSSATVRPAKSTLTSHNKASGKSCIYAFIS